MHLSLRLIFCHRCLNFINVRTAYASKIQAPPTKNPLANSGTTRFREHILLKFPLPLRYLTEFSVQKIPAISGTTADSYIDFITM